MLSILLLLLGAYLYTAFYAVTFIFIKKPGKAFSTDKVGDVKNE